VSRFLPPSTLPPSLPPAATVVLSAVVAVVARRCAPAIAPFAGAQSLPGKGAFHHPSPPPFHGRGIVRVSPIYGDYLQSVKFIFAQPSPAVPRRSVCVADGATGSRGEGEGGRWSVRRSSKQAVASLVTHANNNYSPGLTRKAGPATGRTQGDIDVVSIKAEISIPPRPAPPRYRSLFGCSSAPAFHPRQSSQFSMKLARLVTRAAGTNTRRKNQIFVRATTSQHRKIVESVSGRRVGRLFEIER